MGKGMVFLARELRQNHTNAERLLWTHLRGKQVADFKFRRQQPIGRYIVDFVCFDRKIVVEVDGWQHLDNPEDRERDSWLNNEGFTVLRFWNHEVLLKLRSVLEVIRKHLLAPPHPGPLPRVERE